MSRKIPEPVEEEHSLSPGRTQHSSTEGLRTPKMVILGICLMSNHRNNIYETQEALKEERKQDKHQENHSQSAIFENKKID